MQTKTEKLTLRVSKEFMTKLEELCEMYKMNKTALLERLVNNEYMKSTEKGQAEIRALVQEFSNFTKSLEQFGK